MFKQRIAAVYASAEECAKAGETEKTLELLNTASQLLQETKSPDFKAGIDGWIATHKKIAKDISARACYGCGVWHCEEVLTYVGTEEKFCEGCLEEAQADYAEAGQVEKEKTEFFFSHR